MSPDAFLKNALIPALRLLPDKMDTPAARAEIIAICLQESRLKHRKQIGGPARGYGQFEQGGGIRGVLTHPATMPHIRAVLTSLDYDPMSDPADCYIAIEHNDILAAAFCRLNLWWLPGPLPKRGDAQGGWDTYIAAWRPGKPHRDTFNAFYDQAWSLM